MKIRLTEQQLSDLTNNLNGSTIDNLDMEKEAPNLTKLIKSMLANKNLQPGQLTQKKTPIKDRINSLIGRSDNKLAKNIPSGNQMMHPLGHKEPITSTFGNRNTGIAGASTNHKGVDISTPSGSPVYAPLDGVVLDSRDTSPNACGGFVRLEHINMETKFCHLSRLNAKQGEKVKKGQIIGYSGGGRNDPMHGISSGPHLHYEILDKSGIAMNPVSVEPNLMEHAKVR